MPYERVRPAKKEWPETIGVDSGQNGRNMEFISRTGSNPTPCHIFLQRPESRRKIKKLNHAWHEHFKTRVTVAPKKQKDKKIWKIYLHYKTALLFSQ